MDPVDIIIPVWNERDLTERCIDSILSETDYFFRIIIIDNGSDKRASDYIDSLAQKRGLNASVIKNKTNIGFLKAVNQGFAAATAPYICVLNNDTVVSNGWLKNMIALFHIDPSIGIINPSSNIFGIYPEADDIKGISEKLKHKSGQYTETEVARGFCMLIKKELLDNIGPFDEIFGPGYFEESDFSRRAVTAGYKCVICESSYVYHIGRASFNKLTQTEKLFSQNAKTYHARWGEPYWISFLTDKTVIFEKIFDLIKEMLADGIRIRIYSRFDIADKTLYRHINLVYHIHPCGVTLRFFYGLLKYKKSKAVKMIIVPKKFKKLFMFTGAFHKAEVFDCTDTADIKSTAKKLLFDNYNPKGDKL